MHKLQIISKLIAWNGYLALKAAIASRFDVIIVILTIASNRNIQVILLLLMQNYDKVVARRFLVRIAGRSHRLSVGIDVLMMNVNL